MSQAPGGTSIPLQSRKGDHHVPRLVKYNSSPFVSTRLSNRFFTCFDHPNSRGTCVTSGCTPSVLRSQLSLTIYYDDPNAKCCCTTMDVFLHTCL